MSFLLSLTLLTSAGQLPSGPVSGATSGPCLSCRPDPGRYATFFLKPARCPSDRADGRGSWVKEPYLPKEGDLYFGWGGNIFFRGAYLLALAGPPSHGGIIVRGPDGNLAVLEATTDEPEYGEKAGVYIRPMLPRLSTYQGIIWVRRLKTPLTPDQSVRLTAFAVAQEGKPFTTPRSITVPQLTYPGRGPLVNAVYGPASTDRKKWFCSELMTCAMIEAGLIDPCSVKPSSIRPKDLFIDRFVDIGCCWDKPYRWFIIPLPCPAPGPGVASPTGLLPGPSTPPASPAPQSETPGRGVPPNLDEPKF